MSVRHLVIGTAGHIDHGKSALVLALTGIDPDRLKEEKARGITIDLGFADMDLGDDRVLSFVDVPGHERFVRHMVSGATGIDAVILVVAADDGVRPQTREHLDICSLLGIESGLIALSKADLVDDELLEVVQLEVREFLQGTFLENAPLVAVSARTGAGIESLRDALEGMFESVRERSSRGIVRLPVDRTFVMRGFGTVVTGTLLSGVLKEGDEVEVLPGARTGRVRGLQVHRRRVDRVRAGQRTAVNIQGLDKEAIPRGSTVAAPGSLPTTRRIWARVRLLPSAPEMLLKGGPVRFHQGTCEREGKLKVLRMEDDGTLAAEIRLTEETVLLPSDRFILRRPAPVNTVGGGTVVDIRPPRGRRASLTAFDLGSPGPAGGLLLRLSRAGLEGRTPAGLASELGLSVSEIETEIARFAEEGRAVRAAGLFFDGEAWADLAPEVERVLGKFHEEEPLRPGMFREEVRGRVCPEMPQEAWRVWIEQMASEGRLRPEGERVALADHRVVLSDEDERMAARIEDRFREGGLEPPDAAEVLAAEGGDRAEKILDLLVLRRRLVRIRDGRPFHAEALASLRAKLGEFAKTSRRIDVASFKKLAGVTRKNAIPLLEYLDGERVTRRVGNEREIL